MKLPQLSSLAQTDAHIKLGNSFDENGELAIDKEVDVKARKESSNSVIYTKEGAKVTLKAKLFIFEKLDEFPDDSKGFCVVGESNYDIANVSKKYNPDGTVHHVVLELI